MPSAADCKVAAGIASMRSTAALVSALMSQQGVHCEETQVPQWRIGEPPHSRPPRVRPWSMKKALYPTSPFMARSRT